MQDPVSQYPHLDIPEQRQTEPGLDSALIPKADHGITTYEGRDRLKGRKALITGGDSGIGRAVAIAFAREGADVALTYLPDEESDLVETLNVFEGIDIKSAGIEADFTKEEAVRAIPSKVVEELGGLDIVVNNAGKQVFKEDFTQIDTTQLLQTFTVNFFSMFWICQEAIQYLKPGASIINTTSIQATKPSVGLLDYASTKGAITTFTQGLAQEMTPKGVRVNAVAPGPIWTPLQPSYGQSLEKLIKFGQNTPIGRAGQPAELAPLYVFLASQESSYISGEVIGTTGGKLR